MSWIFLSLLAPLLFAVTNYIDKILVDRFYNNSKTVAPLALYSAFFSVVLLILIPIFDYNTIFVLDLKSKIILFFSGVIQFFAIVYYLKSFKCVSVSQIYSVFLMIPIFGLLFDIFLFDEKFHILQIFGSFLIIISIFFINHSSERKFFSIENKKFIGFALVSSFLYSFSRVLFKFITLDDGSFWVSIFWEHLGILFPGIIIFLFLKTFRREFINTVVMDGKMLLFINLIGEFIAMVGNLCLFYALLLAPVLFVNSFETLQQIFVVILGALLSFIVPKLYYEKSTPKELFVKFSLSVVSIFGVILIIFF